MQAPPPPSQRSSRGKQAACLTCRRSKIKCVRTADDSSCEKCEQTKQQCIVPNDYSGGRQRGVKNKRTGLDRAVYQVLEAAKRVKRDISHSDDDVQTISELEFMLNSIKEAANDTPEENPTDDSPLSFHSNRDHSIRDESLDVDDAENPLQLLARASDIRVSQKLSAVPDLGRNQHVAGSSVAEARQESAVRRFFLPPKANLDVRSDLDPIDLGLVTVEEAENLFGFYYEKLAHTRWGLDPILHTVSFVRKQSSFLFTSVLAAAALFLPSAAPLSIRLSRHREHLARQVVLSRYRSVEIVLAFLINIPWMPPGARAADDDTGEYLSLALSIALDLSLDRIVTISFDRDSGTDQVPARADRIDGSKALRMDGFEEVDPSSELGVRLLRRRERAWISLFTLERGVCLARGRSHTCPVTALIEHCESWHASPFADSRDGSLVSIAIFRRDLHSLLKKVRSNCDNYRLIDVGSDVAHSIKDTIEDFYRAWSAKWTSAIGEGQLLSLPPYVEILIVHGQLSTYASVINHPTAPVEVKRFFRSAGLASALNVMRAAIQGEAKLKSMPNNTAIMVTFAACFALSLSSATSGNNSNLTPSVRTLIEETADILVRIGSYPPHRKGASTLYGEYLRELVKTVPTIPSSQEYVSRPELATTGPSSIDPMRNGHSQPTASTTQPDLQEYPQAWLEPLQLSTMSDFQIIDTINQVDTSWNMSPNFALPTEDLSGFDWFEWGYPTDFGF
ncbi:Zn(II)2Cys6 transcription factor [Aulographum hederae CBS 113979]|uniref:Zn(II)2Cys6 transcription factor n=1 Tax=Aulographum hederae CBS 113979 TaxID=1176131 RepID=A0A6G1GYS3_9PEZI|nr:Zn(II)2Cys6 transcription factor [Aulographum hederae CBS 113979]